MSNEPTIEQMNAVIAEYMGYYIEEDTPKYYKSRKDNTITTHHNIPVKGGLKYHTSWDWLMRVVEKIEKDCCSIIELVIYSSSCCINKWNPHTGKYDSFIHEAGNKRDAVYKAVYQFITWLNQQKQNNV